MANPAIAVAWPAHRDFTAWRDAEEHSLSVKFSMTMDCCFLEVESAGTQRSSPVIVVVAVVDDKLVVVKRRHRTSYIHTCCQLNTGHALE